MEKLCPEVKKLVEERKIDSIKVVHNMRSFDPEAQKIIAKEVLAGRLSGDDVKILAPFRKSSPELAIEQLNITYPKNQKTLRYMLQTLRSHQN